MKDVLRVSIDSEVKAKTKAAAALRRLSLSEYVEKILSGIKEEQEEKEEEKSFPFE